MSIDPTTFIHPSSIIDDNVTIGENCKIWHWTHISSGAKIGHKCSLGQNVYVSNKVKIGNNVKIQNNVSIYDNVILEDNVFCGPSMVFTNVYNPRSEINRKDEYKTTIIRNGATLGANCTIVCGVTINESAFVGAGALVNKDVKKFALVVGVPAKQIGWISRYGERIDLPLKGEGEWICKKTGSFYILKDEEMIQLLKK
tara:strand:- start:1546 stop:2142 length:597 start_codon:yes stop_codon:yes gene_type:complete